LDVRPARVEVHIEELVLHGFPPLDRHAVGEAVQRELGALVASRPLGAPVSADTVDAGRFDAPAGWGADALGTRVAERVREAIG